MVIMLEAIKLSKIFDEFVAVKGVSFTAKEGEVVGFLGPNGAGKTTTMKMLTGFLSPTEGKVIVNGIDMEEDPVKVKQLIGYLPEGVPIYQDMTVLEFLLFIAAIRGFKGKEKYKRISYVVEKIALDGVLGQTIETLSKGYKCRVGLAQALLHDPKIIIFDEPTDGLDPNQKQEVRNLIKIIAKEKVIIISTHLLEEVEAICDRLIIINKGKIVVDSTPLELLERSKYYNTVTITIEKTIQLEEIRNRLLTLVEIKQIEVLNEQEDKVHLRIYLAPECTALINICNYIFQQHWKVTDFQPAVSGHLQEIFRKATQNQRKIG